MRWLYEENVERSDNGGKKTDGKRCERRWLMGNIIPLDVNVVGAVINKRWKKTDGAT